MSFLVAEADMMGLDVDLAASASGAFSLSSECDLSDSTPITTSSYLRLRLSPVNVCGIVTRNETLRSSLGPQRGERLCSRLLLGNPKASLLFLKKISELQSLQTKLPDYSGLEQIAQKVANTVVVVVVVVVVVAVVVVILAVVVLIAMMSKVFLPFYFSLTYRLGKSQRGET